MLNVTKRTGEVVPFDDNKIYLAIKAAADTIGGLDPVTLRDITTRVVHTLKHKANSLHTDTVHIEFIQDTVEDILIERNLSLLVKSYIKYRDTRQRHRDISTSVSLNKITDYLDQSDWTVKENANMGFSLQGLNNHISSALSANYWLNEIYPPRIADAHKSGSIHIHDAGLISNYCAGWDLEDFLLKGFTGVPGKISSTPPKHFRTALGQLVNLIFTLQGESAGAQAVSNFDTLLAPFVREDNLTYKQVKQAMQEFIFNINVPTRVGFQCPFFNLTMDVVPPTRFKNKPVIIGGEYRDTTYGEYAEEMILINKAFCEVMVEGDSSGRIFTFPIVTINLTKEFDWDNPNLDSFWEMTGKYGIPYFANYVNSDIKAEDITSMCCRLSIDRTKLNYKGGGLFGAAPKTGSINVTTINLPRLGYLSEDMIDLKVRLKDIVDLCVECHTIKRDVLEDLTEKGLYPYSKYYLQDTKDHTGQYWANHFNTIGIIGMNECLMMLCGESMTTPKGNELALEIMDFLRELLVDVQENKGGLYNLEATPAESTATTLALKDIKQYGPDNIVFHGTVESPYYTNSTHIAVDELPDDLFELLDIQEATQCQYSGGTVIHVFLGERIVDTTSTKNLVRKICENYRLPYFSLSPTFSTCNNHGYINSEVPVCLICGEPTEIYSRITGYYRPISTWNKGKTTEFNARKTFSV